MTILALEFYSARRSVALARGGVVLAEAVEQSESRETHAFKLIESVLAEAKLSRSEITAMAIGLGPGSYTGIRAAIALAQGWQLATQVKLLGISSADALAVQAQTQKRFGRINVVIDAQRREFYLATWQISRGTRSLLEPLKIVTAAEMEARRACGEVFIGPEQEPRFFPQAATLAQLAASRTDFSDGATLAPIYLRATTFVKAGGIRSI